MIISFKGKLLPENGGSTSLLSAEQTLDVVTYLENIIHQQFPQTFDLIFDSTKNIFSSVSRTDLNND